MSGGRVDCPYDFEILIDETLDRLGIAASAPDSTYDHRVNFSGIAGFTEIEVGQDRTRIDVTATNLAHVLLADVARHEAFAKRYKTATPLGQLAAKLDEVFEEVVVYADIFYATYRLAGASSS